MSELINFQLTDDEKEMMDLLEKICQEQIVPARAGLDEHEEFPHQILKTLGESGFFGILYEEEYGGMNASPMLIGNLVETVSKYCLGVATAFFASRLGSLPIAIGGTHEQKIKYLTPLASGEKIAAFGLTEPNAGSDVPALSTTAEKKGDHYILNGTKQWISNAGVADTYTIFALTDKAKGPRGVSVFILEKGMKGLSFGKLENKLGIRCSHTRQIIMEDVEVPAENLIGLMPGKGFIHALKTLNASRPLVAMMGVGSAQAAYNEAAKYAYEREQFGKKIINFQAVNHMLADMIVKIEAARLLAYKATVYAYNRHPEAAKHSSIAKLYAAEIANQVAYDALQLHGGYGFTKDYPIEKIYRDVRILPIYEGTSQIQRNEIASYIIKEAQQLSTNKG